MHYEVLLVDDEPMVTQSLKRLFKGEFSAIYEAQSGEDALALLQQHPIDMVISDFRMPYMNGGELLGEIHKRHPQILKVMLSGQTDMEGFAQALNHGAISKFLCKPWNSKQLKHIIAETIQEHEQKQTRDKVTGLPSLKIFTEQIKLFGSTEFNGACVALVNLNHFTQINTQYGTQIGNHVLALTAQRIESAFPGQLMTRVIDDHFAIVLRDPAYLADDADLLCQVIANPMFFGDIEIRLFCTIGITALKDWQADIQANLHRNIMHLHSNANRDTPVIFCEPRIEDNGHKSAKFLRDLQYAIKENELSLFYQPQVDARNLKVIGCEALLRWNHPELGAMSPAQFVPLIERHGMTHELTVMILDQALSYMASEPETFRNIRLSINLFASQLGDPLLSSLILNKLKLFGISPAHFEIEITETHLISNFETAREQLAVLRRAGVSIAIDDFGTGYATYECLCELPIDVVKIDGCFIKAIPQHKESFAALVAMIATAKALDLKVVAECVETQEQVLELTRLGCNTFQGYWFSEPLDADSFSLFTAVYNNSYEGNINEVHI